MALNIQSVFTIIAGVQGQPAVDRFVGSLGQGKAAGDRFKGAVLGMKGALGALGIGLSAVAIVGWARHAVGAADQAVDMAKSVGVAASEFVRVSIAAKTAGVDTAALTQS